MHCCESWANADPFVQVPIHASGIGQTSALVSEICWTSTLRRTLLSPTDSCRNRPELEDSGNSGGIRFGIGASQNGNSIPAEYPPESAYSRNAERNDRNGIRPECDICIVYYI